MEALVAYVHYLSMIGIAGFLVAELVLCRPGLEPSQVRLLARLDIFFFAAALLVLGSGVLRLFLYAKGWSFYAGNPVFWVKMALYVAIALISIGPTMQFIRWKRALAGGGPGPTDVEIARARRRVHRELGLLALMPLMAVLMARGVGRW